MSFSPCERKIYQSSGGAFEFSSVVLLYFICVLLIAVLLLVGNTTNHPSTQQLYIVSIVL